jgi:hypothetical protein
MTAPRRTAFATLTTAALATALALVSPASTALGAGGGHGHDHDGGAAPSHLDLPNGFMPEGITTGPRHSAYLGSRADGDIYRLDLRTGRGRVISEGPGTPSVGLKLDESGLLYVSGGDSGTARVVDSRSGQLLATYTLVPAGTPSFINDVVLTDDAAWFTDSLGAALYQVPLGGRHEDGHHGHHGDHEDHGHQGHHRGDDDGHGHGHHGDHGDHDQLPGQDQVTRVPLTGTWVQDTGNNANGITETPDGNALLVVNSASGLLYRVGQDGVATVVDLGGYALTNGDGLLLEGRALYAVQNRLNQVAVLRLDKSGRSGRLAKTLTSADFDVPTTIARSGGDLYLPNARFTTPPTPDTPYWVTGIDD